jgi:hypothetical protein
LMPTRMDTAKLLGRDGREPDGAATQRAAGPRSETEYTS